MKNSSKVLVEVAKLESNKEFIAKKVKEKKEWLVSNYQLFLKEEISSLNGELMESGVSENLTYRANNYLAILEEVRKYLNKNTFLTFLQDCDLTSNEAKVIEHCLEKEGLDQNILNVMIDILEKKSINALKEYRESPQSRRDIKNPINDEKLDSLGVLKPILTFLSGDIAPAVRMELWQKFELYFNSGWGFEDLTNNPTKSTTAKELKELLENIKNKSEVSQWSSEGQTILALLSKRITELGVPVKITNKLSVNNEKIPTASIEKDMQYIYNARKVTAAGFVDWAIPDFKDKETLHFSLATSDETLSIENSQLFRYSHAINKLMQSGGEFKKAKMYFFGVSSFYDVGVSEREIGNEFLDRFCVTGEERQLLNLLPFLSMTDTVNSNYSTGIYSPEQLVDYSFCLMGARSVIENNQKYNIEELFEHCIHTTLEVLNRDKSIDKYADAKTQQIVSYLYHMISCAQNEFYENEALMGYLFSDSTVNKLNNIRKKLPDATMQETFVSKNNFQRLIDSIDGQDPVRFKKRQNMRKAEALEEQSRVMALEKLAKKLMQLQALDNQYDKSLENKFITDDWLKDLPYERVNTYREILLNLYLNLEDGRTKKAGSHYDTLFFIAEEAYQGRVANIRSFNRENYPLGEQNYYKHKKIFDKFDNQKNDFLIKLKNEDYSGLAKNNIKRKDTNLLLNFMYTILQLRDHNDNEFEQIININIPTAFTFCNYSNTNKEANKYIYDMNKDIEELNKLRKFIKQENINSVIQHNNYIDKAKEEIIEDIRRNYAPRDITFIEEKLQLKIASKIILQYK